MCSDVNKKLLRNKAIEWGKSIKADVHIGRRVLYDKSVIDRVLDRMGRDEK